MRRYKIINGVRLSFDEYNQGEVGIILLHAAGGSNSLTESHAQYFAKLGFHVINANLRGHGEIGNSVLPAEKVEEFASDIYHLAHECGIKQAIMIGLNYGGNVAIEIAATHPNFVSHLILLNTPVLMADWTKKLMTHYVQGLRDNIEDYVEFLIKGTAYGVKEEYKKLILEDYKVIPGENLALMYDNLLIWDETSREKLVKCKMPMLYIKPAQAMGSCSLIKQICPHLVTGRVVGANNWMSIEVPKQINPMIERFLEVTEINKMVEKEVA